jgi:hypothetical protein
MALRATAASRDFIEIMLFLPIRRREELATADFDANPSRR